LNICRQSFSAALGGLESANSSAKKAFANRAFSGSQNRPSGGLKGR
jgi:hypothetical protein